MHPAGLCNAILVGLMKVMRQDGRPQAGEVGAVSTHGQSDGWEGDWVTSINSVGSEERFCNALLGNLLVAYFVVNALGLEFRR